MIDNDIKARLLAWRDTPAVDRDYSDALKLLADVSGNRSFLFAVRNPDAKKEFIDYQLSKYLKFVLANEQIVEVREMEKKVKDIVKENLSLSEEKEEAGHRGKRDDHDLLPDEIKALYVENLDLLRQLRELHLKLRLINEDEFLRRRDGYCYEADRYPLLKQMIEIDKKMHDNWKSYDSFVPTQTISFES